MDRSNASALPVVSEINPAGGSLPAIEERLDRFSRAAAGAFSPNTERALKGDIELFTTWCGGHGFVSLPAAPDAVAAFIDAMLRGDPVELMRDGPDGPWTKTLAGERAPATVRRYCASISTYHRAAGLPSPTADDIVRLALKRMHRAKGRRQKQVRGLVRAHVDRMLEVDGDRLLALRNRALLSVAYDGLFRRSELVALAIGDVTFNDAGDGSVLLRRSKSDQEGAGMIRYLHADTCRYLRTWLERADLREGLLFRSVTRAGRVGDSLSAGEVSEIYRRMAKAAGLAEAQRFSGHSTRVGSVQDMLALGIELSAAMQSGGWKSPTMPARYGENLTVRRSGAAKLAILQNRA